MQEEVLERYPDADLRVYVVWLPVLPLDERFAVADVMVDARASHFWDNDQLVSDDLAQAFGSEGQLIWDAFFAFGPDAEWDERPPVPLATGAPVVEELETLETALQPYLG